MSAAEARWVHARGTTAFPELLLTRDAISYSQTHWVSPDSLSPRTAVCSAAFPLVFSLQCEELSVNQAEVSSWHDFCSQRLNSVGKQVKLSSYCNRLSIHAGYAVFRGPVVPSRSDVAGDTATEPSPGCGAD